MTIDDSKLPRSEQIGTPIGTLVVVPRARTVAFRLRLAAMPPGAYLGLSGFRFAPVRGKEPARDGVEHVPADPISRNPPGYWVPGGF